MTSIEFGKKCKPYLVQYRNIFGEVPQFSEYECNQDEFLQALLRATETKDKLYGQLCGRSLRSPHYLRLNLRWETFLRPETVAPQRIRVCGPAQYGLKAARRAPQFSKR